MEKCSKQAFFVTVSCHSVRQSSLQLESGKYFLPFCSKCHKFNYIFFCRFQIRKANFVYILTVIVLKYLYSFILSYLSKNKYRCLRSSKINGLIGNTVIYLIQYFKNGDQQTCNNMHNNFNTLNGANALFFICQ